MATLRFQSTERQAWLAELDDSAPRSQGDLCQRHAAALVLPRGWELHDERASGASAPAGADASAAALAPENGNGARLVRVRRAGAAPDTRVEPQVETEADAQPDDGAESNGNGARSVPAQFGSNDDDAVDEVLDTILDARTPLLRRAFRNAKPG